MLLKLTGLDRPLEAAAARAPLNAALQADLAALRGRIAAIAGPLLQVRGHTH